MYPAAIASQFPDRAAILMAAGQESVVTYNQLSETAENFAAYLDAVDPDRTATVAIIMANDPRYLAVAWAVRQTGRYFTPVNWHLTAREAAYIIDNCQAQVLVTAGPAAQVASELSADLVPRIRHRLAGGVTLPGWDDLDAVLEGRAPASARPLTGGKPDIEGDIILYSSGTTGRPKGIRRALPSPTGMDVEVDSTIPFLRAIGFGDGDVFLTPAPLYHASPIHWSMAVQRLGGTLVLMERFDAEQALALIARHRVTHANFVPTMFVRLLKLAPEVRARYDVSSLQQVVHTAAPCPEQVKHDLITWWGPIISEFWASSEGAGATFVTSDEWLEHPGTVGRTILGTLHILDDEGVEVPPGEIGTIWAENVPQRFEYVNDEDATQAQRNEQGWVTVGDIGYLDSDGFLFLTDRKAYMFISGGVNVYPQEAEDVLLGHPQIRDAAVFGIPDPDLGERAQAVIELMDGVVASPQLADEIIAYCRDRLAHYKCPRAVDFTEHLPRSDSGKLYKRLLRDEYRARIEGLSSIA